MDNVYRGEIYYADLSPVVGSKQDGTRPVLCIQNNVGNLHSQTIIVAALTSRRTKHRLLTHVDLQVKGLAQKSIVLLEQIRTIDKSRLESYVGTVTEEDMKKIDRAIRVSFALA